MAFKLCLHDQHNMTKYLQHTGRDYDEGKSDFDNDNGAGIGIPTFYYKVKCQNKIMIIKKIIPC